MRADQYVGLNEWAVELVREGTRTGITVEKIGEIEGAWDPVVDDIRQYTFPNGRVYRERVQAEPWSSGPCYFVALVDETGAWVPESLWTDEEIMAA